VARLLSTGTIATEEAAARRGVEAAAGQSMERLQAPPPTGGGTRQHRVRAARAIATEVVTIDLAYAVLISRCRC